MLKISSVAMTWVPWAVMSVVMPGLVYVAVQQDLRQSANDPQIQMAEDVSVQLNQGVPAQSVISRPTIDIAKSLSPIIIVYDQSGHVLASSGQLNGKTPQLPDGVLKGTGSGYQRFTNASIQTGELRFTWQPQPGIRLAAVVTNFSGPHPGFILAARNIREVESREQNILLLTAVVSLLLLIFTAASTLVLRRRNS